MPPKRRANHSDDISDHHHHHHHTTAGRARKRAKKDPNAPKKPLSAYLFFSQDNRKKTKEENPDATFGELGRILGQKWKEMTEEDKKIYVIQAEEDKKRYDRQQTLYEKDPVAYARDHAAS